MAEPQYRYGGPVPERAQWLKKRRERRASSLFATVKRGRARDREEAAAMASRGLIQKCQIEASENQNPRPGGTRR